MNQQEENFDNINFAETKEETDKKCPQCGGIMDFDPKTGHMKCGFCDYEEEIAVSDEEMARRRAAWQPREPKVKTGYLARYAALVTSAAHGAVLEAPKN